MAERAERLRVVGGPGPEFGGNGRRDVRYGLVFCELAPGGRASRRPAEAPAAPASPKPARAPVRRTHGTYAKAVVEDCSCERCRAAKADYRRRRRQAIARPDEAWQPYVSAEPVRRHVAGLRAAGMSLEAVARSSGVSHGALSKIVYGQPGRGRPPSRRVRPLTLEKILAVKGGAGSGRLVDAGPTWALIEELVAAGHTHGDLARALGSRAAVPSLQLGRRRVRASTARSVERMHRALIKRPPPPPSSKS